MEVMFNVPVPLLVSVTSCTVELEPTKTLGKVSVVGLNVTAG